MADTAQLLPADGGRDTPLQLLCGRILLNKHTRWWQRFAAGVGSPGGSQWECVRAAEETQAVWRRLHFERSRAKASPGGSWRVHDPGFLISASVLRGKAAQVFEWEIQGRQTTSALTGFDRQLHSAVSYNQHCRDLFRMKWCEMGWECGVISLPYTFLGSYRKVGCLCRLLGVNDFISWFQEKKTCFLVIVRWFEQGTAVYFSSLNNLPSTENSSYTLSNQGEIILSMKQTLWDVASGTIKLTRHWF